VHLLCCGYVYLFAIVDVFPLVVMIYHKTLSVILNYVAKDYISESVCVCVC